MNTGRTRPNSGRIKNDRLRDRPKATPLPLVGYMRVSKADGSQTLDLQRDALDAASVPERNIYSDTASGKRDDRPGLESCLKALRAGDTLVVWKLDRLGRNLRHLVNVVHDLTNRDIGPRVLTGQGAASDITTAGGKLILGIFAALAEFEWELISERPRAGLGCGTGAAKVRLAEGAMGKRHGGWRPLRGFRDHEGYYYVSPAVELRPHGKKVVGF